MLTEMYSLLCAEIPITVATSYNKSLQQILYTSSKVFIMGQALSHCVNYTLRDLVVQPSSLSTTANKNDNDNEDNQNMPSQSSSASSSLFRNDQIYLLVDCCSSVPGYESNGLQFIQDMKQVGVHCIESTQVQL
jgi:nicotinamidase/pyrazinamidase